MWCVVLTVTATGTVTVATLPAVSVAEEVAAERVFTVAVPFDGRQVTSVTAMYE
jgi:hypothetical protein